VLFRPVSGPELEVIYALLCRSDVPLTRHTLGQRCLPHYADRRTVSRQNLDDALSFLITAHLVQDDEGLTALTHQPEPLSFRLLLLRQLHALAAGEIDPSHETDALYLQLLDHLFVKPDQLYVADVHVEANKLRSVVDIGGISQEKIRSWKRVMAFLGIGHRIAQGFQCRYAPDLLLEILCAWPEREGILQELFESHLALYLPFQTESGELAQAVSCSLLHLNQQQIVLMSAYQDSSSKPYFGDKRWRYLTHGEIGRDQ
jgi:hypothetical protein